MKNEDRKYMKMAISQARAQLERYGFDQGGDRPNPLVGCVVVTKSGKVVASYRGEREGEPDEHAEYVVAEKKLENEVLAGATVYTTLEPCADRNSPKTPCADWLLERKVARVVIGIMDPDERGQGYHKLRRANISVVLCKDDDLVAEIEELNRKYIRSRERLRPSAETEQRVADYTLEGTVVGHLKRLAVPRNPAFTRFGYFLTNPDRKCIETIISVENLNGVEGVSGDMIVVKEIKDEIDFPPYLHAEILRTRVSGRDANKTALRGFCQMPLDVNLGTSTLEVSCTKYRTKIAMRAVRSQLLDDLLHNRLRIVENDIEVRNDSVPVLPCHLHCDGLVITGDGKVLLAQRGSGVDLDAFQWASSFGESMEWDKDRGDNGKLHPLRTVWRGLQEELGLHEGWVMSRFGQTTRITFLELAFQIDSLIYIIFSMIEFPQLTVTEALDRARNYRTDKEPRAFGSMEFSPSQCAAAIVSGSAGGKKLNHAGRFGLLLAALNRFDIRFLGELARMA